jgi:MFS family permease
VRPLTPAAALGGARLPLRGVVGQIAWPGLALALAGIGFAAISTFATLDFVAHGWPGAGGALFAFGGCFVAVRVAGSGLADRVRGQILAAGSMAVACLGQTVLWIAPNGVAAIAGAGLTGLGCSLVFPALGVLAVRRVPDASRGIAIGAFAAFQDLAIGLTGPLLGAIASVWGFPAVFLGGGLAAAAGAVVSLTIAPRRAP